jgi:hypothetical protein
VIDGKPAEEVGQPKKSDKAEEAPDRLDIPEQVSFYAKVDCSEQKGPLKMMLELVREAPR